MLKLTSSKYRALSTICSDTAQVFFAIFIATIVAPLPLDFWKIMVIILELGFAVLFWILSVFFAERGKL